MFSLLVVYFFLQVRPVWSLRCATTSQLDCLWNSTCRFSTELCNESRSAVRGGVFCSALVEPKGEEKIHVKHFGCMYDQEATKTCVNQSTCQLKFTNKEQHYLHCCCDQPSCNLQLDRSNPTIDFSLADPPSVVDARCVGDECADGWRRAWREHWGKVSLVVVLVAVVVVMVMASLLVVRRERKGRKNGVFARLCRKCSTSTTKKKFVDLSSSAEERGETSKLTGQALASSSSSVGGGGGGGEETLPHWRRDELKIDSHPFKRGRFSQIYRCEHQGQPLVLKLLRETPSNKQIVSLFQHEKAIYSLPHFQHVNLLKCFGSLVEEKNYHLVLEWAPLGSLRDYLKENLVETDAELFDFSSQIANGLAHLHRDFSPCSPVKRFPIAHRDLKSDNILLFADRRLVISDFAMSIHLDEKDLSSTDQQQQMGTPRYMSPEILAGTIGNELISLLRSDVYSLGLVLWEILSRAKHLGATGPSVLPYDDQLRRRGVEGNPTIEQMLEIVLADRPSNRPSVNPQWRSSPTVNERLLRTIEQCWDATPEGRINASLVAHRLQPSTSPLV